jgi:hypothetical protein
MRETKKTLEQYIVTNQEREREREREGNLTSPLCWPEKVVLVRVYLL